MKKKRKFAVGGRVNNYVKNPSETLTELDILKAQAQYEAETDPLVNITGIFSALSPLLIQAGMPSFEAALGGMVGEEEVEVEGNEVAVLPEGLGALEFEGPSHAEGGIDVTLPTGTEIFSDRILVEGETMAERAKAREKKMSKMEALAERDSLAKNALKRITTSNAAQEAQDRSIQSALRRLEEADTALSKLPKGKELEEYPLGGIIGDDNERRISRIARNSYAFPAEPSVSLLPQANVMRSRGLPNYNPQVAGLPKWTPPSATGFNTGITNPVPGLPYHETIEEEVPGEERGFGSRLLEQLGQFTPGDVIGMTGNLMQATAPLRNTLANRAGDTPNINPFLDYGQDALSTMERARQGLVQREEEAVQDLELSRNAAISRGRNSTRGINTARALDLATDASYNASERQLRGEFTDRMSQMLLNQAQMEAGIDERVMMGEAQRDMADRQDRDNFYSNKGEDLMTFAQGISNFGGSLNRAKEREISEQILNQMYRWVEGNMVTGEIKGKPVSKPKTVKKVVRKSKKGNNG